MKFLPLRVLVLFVAWSAPGVSVMAQDRNVPPRRQDEPAKVRQYRETAISPDGKRVAWVEEVGDEAGASTPHSGIFVVDLAADADERTPRRITAGDGKTGCVERSIAWSPDGRRVAFLSDHDKPGQFQVYLAPAEGGEVRRLTSVTGLLADPRWSPDGARLGVLFTRDASRAAGPLQPGEALTGVIDEKVLEQRLSTIDLHSGESGKCRRPICTSTNSTGPPTATRCVCHRGARIG